MHRSKVVLSILTMLTLALATSQSHAQTFTTLQTFNGSNGNEPIGGLTLSGSTLYGMTEYGGSQSGGTIFSLPVTGGAATTIFQFDGTWVVRQLCGPDTGWLDDLRRGLRGGNRVRRTGNDFQRSCDWRKRHDPVHLPGERWSNPDSNLIVSGSTIYGSTEIGGPGGEGTVFSMPLLANCDDAGEFPDQLWRLLEGNQVLAGSTLYGTTDGGGTGGGLSAMARSTASTPTAPASRF